MDITFDCLKCGQHIAIDEAGAGRFVNCPKCGFAQLVPNNPAGQTKKCPFCAETIHADAIKCKHCGEFLNSTQRCDNSAPVSASFHPATPAKAETISEGNIVAAYIIAIILPFVGFFAGIYLMAKKEPGHGVAVIAVSILTFFIWYAVMSS